MRAEHQRAARRRADRLVAIREIEAQAAFGEGINVWRACGGVTVATERRFEIVHQDKEDVGTAGGGFASDCGQLRLNEEQGMTILLIEQNANMALGVAHFGYVLEVGRIVLEGSTDKLRDNPDVKEFYLGHKDQGVRGQRRWKRKKQWR